MAASPRVSVLTTVRNTPSPLLRISLESILEQSVSDLEVIVVIDGDEPEASELAEGFARDDDRVVVLRPGRVGRGRALNIALDTARADLVGIQDADDASHPDRVAVQYDILRCDPELALLCTGANVVWGLEMRAVWPLDPFARPLEYRRLDRQLLRSNPIVHSSVMARADAIRRVGGYDASRVAQLDYDLFLRMRADGAVLGVCDLPLVLHRRHPGQNYEQMVPSSRAWLSYRLQSSHLTDLPTAQRTGYQAIAAMRLAYQIGRGVAWHHISRRTSPEGHAA